MHTSWIIFSGHTSFTWDLCTVRLFWSFDLWPWCYELHLENNVSDMTISHKLYIVAGSYFQGTLTLYGICALWGYFELLTFELQHWPWKFCVWQDCYLQTKHSCWIIISGHTNLIWDLCIVWFILTFDLAIKILTLKFLFEPGLFLTESFI